MLKDVADSKRINTHITDQRAKAERLREEQKAKDPAAAESQENEPQVITFTQTCCYHWNDWEFCPRIQQLKGQRKFSSYQM